MALNIKHEETEELARALAQVTGRSIRECVTDALKSAYNRAVQTRRSKNLGVADRLRALAREAQTLEVRDHRSVDELLGYNDEGFFD